MQKALQRPERALIAHPFNPPHMVPLVELVPGMQTDPAVMARMRTFFQAHGKVPVTLRREVPGHIANRLAAAVWREALYLVEQGVASAEDVDKALCAGPGIRWALIDQHIIYHLGGGEGGYEYFFRQFKPVFAEYWKDMADWTEIPRAAQEAAIQGIHKSLKDRSTQELAQWRDEKLAELIKVIYGQEKTT
jgi:carnitine 3-dehydrogenase